MQLNEFYGQLKQLNQFFIQTRDVAAYFNLTTTHASKLLRRLTQHQNLIHINRGLWAFPEKTDPLALPEYLTQPFPSYISLQTALYHYDMITQIPAAIYAVSLARTKTYFTPLGEVSIHHLDTKFFFDFELLPGTNIKIASPEKALIDFLYLNAAKTKLFHSLPELELPKGFSVKTAKNIITQIPAATIRRATVEKLFTRLIS